MIENVKYLFKSYKIVVLKRETSYLQDGYEKEAVMGCTSYVPLLFWKDSTLGGGK